MVNQVQTSGIIIGKRDIGEADRWFVLLTPDLGKIRCNARGIRKPKARLAAWMDILRYNDLILIRGKSGYVLTGATTRQMIFAGTEDWEMLTSAYYVCEVIDKLFEEGVVVPGVFELVHETLGQIKVARNVNVVRAGFELKLLELLGLSPQLYKCAVSGEELAVGERMQFSLRLGGVLKTSKTDDYFAVEVTPNIVKLLRIWQRYPLGGGDALVAESSEIDVAVSLVSDFMAYVLEYRPKSLQN